MKRSKFSDSQIMSILKQAEGGTPVPEICREHGISSATFYKWRAKYGGMDALMMARLKELEEENRRLKKMYAEEKLKAEVVKEALEKSGKAIPAQGDGETSGIRESDEHSPSLRSFRYQRNLLPLSGEAFDRKPGHHGLADSSDPQSEELGIWDVLHVFA